MSILRTLTRTSVRTFLHKRPIFAQTIYGHKMACKMTTRLS